MASTAQTHAHSIAASVGFTTIATINRSVNINTINVHQFRCTLTHFQMECIVSAAIRTFSHAHVSTQTLKNIVVFNLSTLAACLSVTSLAFSVHMNTVFC